MSRIPKTQSSRIVYRNPYVDIKVDTLERDGIQWEQVYFVKPNDNAAGVIATDGKGIYLVHQYRYASKAFFWQIPMGMIDKGNDPLETAKIELKEEAGIIAEKLQNIGMVVAEPGMSPQKVSIFVATELQKGTNNPTELEGEIKVQYFKMDEVHTMIREGEITCGFTLSALMLFKNNYLSYNLFATTKRKGGESS